MSHFRLHLVLAVLLFVTAAAPAERSAVNAATYKPSDNLSESGYGAWSNIAVKASGAFDFIEPDPSGELPKELHESGNTFEP